MTGEGEAVARPLGWDEFIRVEMRIGTVLSVAEFPEARKPAYRITVDFGPEIGVRKTSAQVTTHYRPEDLTGRQVIGVLNFPVKQIGPVRSEFLLLGAVEAAGAIVVIGPERPVADGCRIA